MLGRHPYAGIYPQHILATAEFADFIAKGTFAYSSEAAARGIRRPPASPSLDILPPAVAVAFKATFGPPPRPTAAHWMQTLQAMKEQLECCRINPAHKLIRGTPCPWCALEKVGLVAFVIQPTGTAAARFVAGEMAFPELAALNAWLTAFPPLAIPMPVTLADFPAPQPDPLIPDPRRATRDWNIGVAMICTLILVLAIVEQQGAYLWLEALAYGIAASLHPSERLIKPARGAPSVRCGRPKPHGIVPPSFTTARGARVPFVKNSTRRVRQSGS